MPRDDRPGVFTAAQRAHLQIIRGRKRKPKLVAQGATGARRDRTKANPTRLIRTVQMDLLYPPLLEIRSTLTNLPKWASPPLLHGLR